MDGELIVILIVLALLLALVVFCFRMAILTSKARKQHKHDFDKRKSKYGQCVFSQLALVSGLPFAENTVCYLYVLSDGLIVEAQEQTFRLSNEQIIAAQAKTDVEINKEVTSSAGQAIVGGLLFGPVGAIVGGRVKTKKTSIITPYLIINYVNQAKETVVLAFCGSIPGSNCYLIADALTKNTASLRTGTITDL